MSRMKFTFCNDVTFFQVHFRVLPGKPYEITYNLFPLVAGHVTLPKLHLNMLRFPGKMDSVIQKMLPTHIFIKVHKSCLLSK